MHLLHLAWRTSLHLSGRTAAAYRIRKCWLDGAEVGVVGAPADLTYPYTHFGQDAAALRQAQSGGKGGVLERLKAAQRPAVLVGPGVLHRLDRDDVLKQVPSAALPSAALHRGTRLPFPTAAVSLHRCEFCSPSWTKRQVWNSCRPMQLSLFRSCLSQCLYAHRPTHTAGSSVFMSLVVFSPGGTFGQLSVRCHAAAHVLVAACASIVQLMIVPQIISCTKHLI